MPNDTGREKVPREILRGSNAREGKRGCETIGFGDGVQEVLEEKSRAIHVWKIVFGSKHQRVGSVRIASIFPVASCLNTKKPSFKVVQTSKCYCGYS
jgi:hypothetical protein